MDEVVIQNSKYERYQNQSIWLVYGSSILSPFIWHFSDGMGWRFAEENVNQLVTVVDSEANEKRNQI